VDTKRPFITPNQKNKVQTLTAELEAAKAENERLKNSIVHLKKKAAEIAVLEGLPESTVRAILSNK